VVIDPQDKILEQSETNTMLKRNLELPDRKYFDVHNPEF